MGEVQFHDAWIASRRNQDFDQVADWFDPDVIVSIGDGATPNLGVAGVRGYWQWTIDNQVGAPAASPWIGQKGATLRFYVNRGETTIEENFIFGPDGRVASVWAVVEHG